MADLEALKHEIHDHEAKLLKELRLIRRGLRRATGDGPPPERGACSHLASV